MDEDENKDKMTAIKLLAETEQPIALENKVTEEKGQEAKSQAPTLEWLTKNFVLVSAVLVIGAATASAVALAAYLSVFDWTLIWLVDYSDLTKLFILFSAFIGSFGVIILSLWQGYFLRRSGRFLYRISFLGD